MTSWLEKLIRRLRPSAGHITPAAIVPRLLKSPAPPDAHGWRAHDGGGCPVPPDTLVEFPSGTYASFNGRGTLGPHRAGDVEWRNDHIRHLRDEIQHYRIMTDAEAAEAMEHRGKRLG